MPNDVALTMTKKSRRLSDTGDPSSLSTRFRAKRDIRLRELISKLSANRRIFSILDLGGSVEYWERLGLSFLEENNAHVVVLNYSSSELKDSNADDELFTTVVGDACNLFDIEDRQFDLVHSNSVLEHVGNWARMKQFASEARRTGIAYYIQTPYFWFPIDPHYYRAPMIHWLPRSIQARMITRFNICTAGKISNIDDAHSVLDGTSLIDKSQFNILFPDSVVTFERFFGLTKSLIAIHDPSLPVARQQS